MSDEYIKKSDAIKAVNDMPYDTFFVEADRMWLIAEIDKLPPADVVERKRGEWEKINIKDYHAFCSCCGVWSPILGNFCHNCGAKMDGEREGK